MYHALQGILEEYQHLCQTSLRDQEDQGFSEIENSRAADTEVWGLILYAGRYSLGSLEITEDEAGKVLRFSVKPLHFICATPESLMIRYWYQYMAEVNAVIAARSWHPNPPFRTILSILSNSSNP